MTFSHSKISIFVDVRSVFKMVKEKLGNEVLYRQRLIKYGMFKVKKKQ